MCTASAEQTCILPTTYHEGSISANLEIGSLDTAAVRGLTRPSRHGTGFEDKGLQMIVMTGIAMKTDRRKASDLPVLPLCLQTSPG